MLSGEAYEQDKVEIPVSVTLDDGTRLKGYIRARLGRKLNEILNGNERFLDFVDTQGTNSYLACNSLKKIIELEAIAEEELMEDDIFDRLKKMAPHEILEVPQNAKMSDVHIAYHKKLKQYHPDRFSQVDLPEEIGAYLLLMTQKINAAYTHLSR